MQAEDSRPDDENRAILGRGWVTLVGAVLGAAMVFGNEILVARHLGVPLYGLYALALVIARIAETLSLFGLRSGLMHFLPVFREQGRAADAVGSIVAALALPLVLGVSFAASVWLAAPWIADAVLDEPAAAPYIRLFALPVPLMCLVEMLGVVTRGFGRASLYVVIRNLTPPATYLILLLGLVVTDGEPLLVANAFAAAQGVAVAVGVGIVLPLVRRDGLWVRPHPRPGELYAYSFPIMLNTLLYVLMSASDILMLGNMPGAADAGIYRACIQFRPAFDMAVVAFNAAAIHLYPVYFKAGRRDELARSYATVVRVTSAVTIALFVLVMLSRSDILALLGPEFPRGAQAMAFLLVGFLFHGCCGSSGMLLVVTGHQRFETASAFVGVVINLGLNVVLIPLYGIVGAGIATACAMLALNAMRIFYVRRYLGLRTLQPDLARSLALGAAAGLVVLGAGHLAGLADGTGLVAAILRSGLAVGLLLLAFRLWGPRERV